MLVTNKKRFIQVPFDSEEEIENVVVENATDIFGASSLYFPKTLIKTSDGTGTIPDGFAIDLAERRWFIVEAETSKHSVWGHIGHSPHQATRRFMLFRARAVNERPSTDGQAGKTAAVYGLPN